MAESTGVGHSGLRAGVFDNLWKYSVAPPVKVEFVLRGQCGVGYFVSVGKGSCPADGGHYFSLEHHVRSLFHYLVSVYLSRTVWVFFVAKVCVIGYVFSFFFV